MKVGCIILASFVAIMVIARIVAVIVVCRKKKKILPYGIEGE